MIIYKVTNKINNKIYIGSTVKKLNIRIRQHKHQAKKGPFSIFQKAINKYGFENFEFEEIASVLSIEYLDDIEQWFIEYFKSLKNGYNAIGVLKGTRELITNVMLKEWQNPIKRKERIEKMRIGSIKKSIVSISIYDGSYRFYESVHDALREGFSTSCLYSCLNNEAKKAQGYCWFYYEEQNPELYVQKAKELLGEFKTDYFKSIKAINKETGEILNFKDTFELKKYGFKPKAVRRVLRGEREGYAGYYWKYID